MSKNVWVKRFIIEDHCLGCDASPAFTEALKVLGETSYSLAQALSLGHNDIDTGRQTEEGDRIFMTVWIMPQTPADLLWTGYRNGIESGYNSNSGLVVEGAKISYTTGGGTEMELCPIWNTKDYPYVKGWKLAINANPDGTLEEACRKGGFKMEEHE